MAAENNIFIKITSEADLDSAQKALQELTKRAEEQEQAMQQLRKEEQEDAKSIKQLGLSEKELADALQKNKKYYQDLRTQKKAETAETKKSIKELQNQVKAYKTLNGISGKAVQQLRAMRERLMEMEDAGEFGTKAFVDLSIAAAKLEDQIGDTQQRIRVLASDTLALDTIAGVGEAISGSFYIAQAGAEIFGDELEALQQTFYKVQNVMAVVSGIQQVYNSLQKDSVVAVVAQNAAAKIKEKVTAKNAAIQAAANVQEAAGVAADGAKTVSTGILTKAQIKLNAAIAANPLAWLIGIVVAAVAAVAALGIGIYKLVQSFSAAAKAQREYAKAVKELEKSLLNAEIQNSAYAQKIVNNAKKIDDAYRDEINEAKKRNASDVELLEIEKKHADERAKIYSEIIPKALKEQKKAVKDSKKAYEDAMDVVNNTSGEENRKEALEQLRDAEQQYIQSQNDYIALQKERDDAVQEATDAEIALNNKRLELERQLEESEINLMREGASKEIAQIRSSYKERLKEISGDSAEEGALRASLMVEQEREIANVRKKYALQAKQAALQEQKNLLKAMSQSRGTEADYQEEIAQTKKVAEEEAKVRIASLDKERMSKEEYNAQVEEIELDLAETLRQIDEQEMNRLAEVKRRETEIVLAEAEAQKNALTGAESQDEQLAILDRYYDARKKQLEENAKLERQAEQRSTDTEEVKAAKIKQINANLQADLTALNKEGEQERINVYSQSLTALEIEADKAARSVEQAQTTGDKLSALQANLDAQKALYKAQEDELERLWNNGSEKALISHDEYLKRRWELTKAAIDAETQYQQDKMQAIADGFEFALNKIQQVSDLAFEAIGQNIQAEMDALDEQYTTDWEEAQKNADKKYITEKEFEKKKAALELKQAKMNKAQALLNIGLSTAQAIMSIWADPTAVWAMKVALTATTSALGAAQLAIAAAKPLPQYEKGRKGGKGEYALVGEKGAEIMYVPQGASIIPHNKITDQAAWADYGVPKLSIPPLPATDIETTKYIATTTDNRLTIDYDKLGEAVARNMPKPQAVTVNVDRSGVSVNDGLATHTYLNRKFAGQWN